MADTIDTLTDLFTSDTPDNSNIDFERLVEDVVRPWGEFHNLARKENEWFIKVLQIKEGQRLSLQKHFKREEMWIVTKGKVRATKGEELIELGPKESIFINVEENHRLEGITDAEFIEISFGDFDENDEVRLEDDYGRVE